MSRPLEGKIAIVTGSSRGIGAAIARNLASKGAHLVLNYSSAGSAQPTADLAKELVDAHGIRCVAVQADVGAPASGDPAKPVGADAIVAKAKAFFCGDGDDNNDNNSDNNSDKFHVDILVNNAGVALCDDLADIQVDDFYETYRINVLGPLRLVQAVLPFVRTPSSSTDTRARIVNISSVSSTCGFVGQSVYGGSKAALEAMTRTWARELADKATVNAVNPGPVEGPMYAANPAAVKDGIRPWIEHAPLMRVRPDIDPLDVVEAVKADPLSGGGRPAYTSEIAGIVAMLCLPDAEWCTGQVVCANGGMLML